MRDPRINNRHARRLAKRRGKSSILAALSSAALALLSQSPHAAQADGPVQEMDASHTFFFYSEDSIARSSVAFGDTARYEIESHQFSIEGPVSKRIDAGFDLVYETMSGATPWYVTPNPSGGAPQQAMSGATVSDTRIDGSVHGNYYFDRARTGAHFGVSGEKDYLALYAGMDGEFHLNEKNTTLSGGLSFSIDEIEPTGGGADMRIKHGDKQSVTVNAGLSQILDRKTTMQSSLTYKYSTGFLSDPYKRACIALLNVCTDIVADSRPDERHQVAWLTQLRHHFESLGASVHVNYRFHYDDWKINSHTFELRWYQNLFSDMIQLVPEFRYYSQSQASFYEPFYSSIRSNGLYSSDYRLSPYGSLSFGGRLQARIIDWPRDLDWRAALHYERHLADADYALSKVKVANPGLVDFHIIYVTVDAKF